jgi:hypothetical protein
MQQGQKGHIVAQAQSGKLTGTLPDLPANTAVNLCIPILLFLGQLFLIGRYKSEHPDPPFFLYRNLRL